jgi:hypothetical protein
VDAVEQKLKALDAFKDWSNYLLVTTVAALGWTAGKDAATFCAAYIKPAAIISFGGTSRCVVRRFRTDIQAVWGTDRSRRIDHRCGREPFFPPLRDLAWSAPRRLSP